MSIIGSNILAGAAGQGGGYVIDNSLRLRSSASAYLNRTFASTPTSWTMSFWVKRGTLGVLQQIFASRLSGTGAAFIQFNGSDQLVVANNATSITTTAVYRDPSAWYHFVVSWTSGNVVTIYCNGVSQTVAGSISGASQLFTSSWISTVGRYGDFNGNYLDGYLTEVNFIDGQALTPSSFGDYNEDTGVWQPAKYAGSYGTNGFYLNFSDNTTTTTLAADSSGNGNDWTPNNISLTAGVTYDSMTDTPTPYEDGGNYAVLNRLFNTGALGYLFLSNGNLTAHEYSGSAAWRTRWSTIGITSGKFYAEFTISYAGATSIASAGGANIGLYDGGTAIYVGQTSTTYGYLANGQKYNNGSGVSYGASYANGDVIGMAYDADVGTLTFFKNGVSQGVAYSGIPSRTYFLALSAYWVPPDGQTNINANFGQRPFAYTPPTGFKSLHTGNLPDSAIENGSEYFDATTYTGNGGTQSIVNSGGFQPDLVWVKYRNQAYNNDLFDSIRGVSKYLRSNTTQAELTYAGYGVTAFNSNGFSVTDDAGGGYEVNGSSGSLVAWNWKAGGAAVTNTAGSITSQVSASPTAGFSVVTYTGTGANGATVGHSLGVAPSMIILKGRSAGTAGGPWYTYHVSTGATNLLRLNTTAAAASDSIFNYTTPASTTFTLGAPAGFSNGSGENYVAYCFSEVSGFSKFGSYTGNASADGPFVYLGFRPKFVITKCADATAGTGDWTIHDTSRRAYNTNDLRIFANASSAESTSEAMDMLSNGFKIRATNSNCNTTGGGYIYMAFAENPFKNSLAR